MRDMTTGFRTIIDSQSMRLCYLVSADFDSGALRLWTGYGDLVYGGQTFTGAGVILNISPVKETQNLEATSLRVELSGIPESIVSLALQEEYQQREITLYLGVVSQTTGEVDAITLFKGRIDIMEIVPDTQNARIGVVCENELIRLRDPVATYLTSEWQKSRYPDDLGLDFVVPIQDRELNWGVTK